MKILLIGGTGTISMAITKLLAKQGHEVILLNRGYRNNDLPGNVRTIKCDISDETDVEKKLADMSFDCVGEFIGFVPSQVERDFRLFSGKTKQYIYISSAFRLYYHGEHTDFESSLAVFTRQDSLRGISHEAVP